MALVLLPENVSSIIGLHGETNERSFMPTGWVWMLNTDCDKSVWSGKEYTGYFWNMF